MDGLVTGGGGAFHVASVELDYQVMTANLASTQTETQWVVIVSDDAQLARDVVERWQAERYVPEFTFMTSELWERAATVCEELSAATDPPSIHEYRSEERRVGEECRSRW